MKLSLNTGKIANLLALLTLVIAIVFNIVAVNTQNITLQASQRIASADYVLRLSEQLDSDKYTNVTNSIFDSTQETQILSTKISEGELNDYIGKLETVAGLAVQGIIDKDMAYQEFSYQFVKTWCNKDIQKYVNKLRSTDNAVSRETEYYHGLEDLATYAMRKEHKDCSKYDNQ